MSLKVNTNYFRTFFLLGMFLLPCSVWSSGGFFLYFPLCSVYFLSYVCFSLFVVWFPLICVFLLPCIVYFLSWECFLLPVVCTLHTTSEGCVSPFSGVCLYSTVTCVCSFSSVACFSSGCTVFFCTGTFLRHIAFISSAGCTLCTVQ